MGNLLTAIRHQLHCGQPRELLLAVASAVERVRSLKASQTSGPRRVTWSLIFIDHPSVFKSNYCPPSSRDQTVRTGMGDFSNICVELLRSERSFRTSIQQLVHVIDYHVGSVVPSITSNYCPWKAFTKPNCSTSTLPTICSGNVWSVQYNCHEGGQWPEG
jgi:hypothetical protein